MHALFFAVAYSGIPVIGMGPQGPHWEITPKEAKDLDAAWVKMWRHFAPQVSQKSADIINFGTTAARIVGPRAVQTAFDKRTRAHAHAHARGQANSPATNGTLPTGAGVAAQPVAAPPPTTTQGTTTPAPAAPSSGPVTPSQQDPLAMGMTHMTAGRA